MKIDPAMTVSVVLVVSLAVWGWRLIGAARNRRLVAVPERGALDVHAVFKHVADGVLVLDRQRRILLMNEAAASLLRLNSGALLTASTEHSFEVRLDGVPAPHDRWPSALALQGVYLQSAEMEIYHRGSGSTSVIRVSTSPIMDGGGDLAQILVMFQDITESRRFEATRKQLAASVEFSHDAIIGKDLSGVVLTWNSGAEAMFGYMAEEMIGRSIRSLLPTGHEDEENVTLERLRRGETVEHLETHRLRKDGRILLVSVAISPVRDATGRIIGASQIARDMTSQRGFERQVQQSQKMEAIGRLTGGISHDFNNLLGVVIGNLDLMEPLLEAGSAASKRLQTAQKAALRGADLTRRLLAFSCTEDLNPTLTSVSDSIRNTIELAGRALGPEIRLRVTLDDALPQVLVDRAGLESMLLNLMVNARDAMPEGGALTVTMHRAQLEQDYPPMQFGNVAPDDYLCVTVSDTGHGMSRETMQRAFEPFFTTKARGRGTGLGLAMAYAFVKQSGGTVRLYSELGYGTSVSFYLPFPPERGAPPHAHDDETTGRDLRGCTVLVVDDEVDLLEIAATYLKEMGCRTLMAVDGTSALRVLAGPADIDVMFTDLMMPGRMGGAALAVQAVAMRPDLRVIYCSGFPADALAERKTPLSEGPLLRKPYQRRELRAFVEQALEARETRKERSLTI